MSKFLGVSVGALLSSLLAFDGVKMRAEKEEKERLRPTPRKPERPRYGKVASANRDKERRVNRAAYRRALRKEAALGIAPVYRGAGRESRAQHEWEKQAKAWDKANG